MKLQNSAAVWTLALLISMCIAAPTMASAADGEPFPSVPHTPMVPIPEEENPYTVIPQTTQSDDPAADLDPEFSADESELGLNIDFDQAIHSIKDPNFPNERIILYCMNSRLEWPHKTPHEPNVPHYTDGYLRPEDFQSKDDYLECTRKLRKILFAGYPYNAKRLYKIIDSNEVYIPTEEEFNEMLIPLPSLITDFPILGHHIFTFEDRYNPKHLPIIRSFLSEVDALAPDKQTANGLTYQDIIAMPFYKAATCLSYETNDPLALFTQLYPNSYFITEQRAYESTQNAIWKLLYDYGVPDNDLSSIEHDALAKILLQYSDHGDLLQTEPAYADIHTEGDLIFSYHPEDGKWHTGKLKIVEPPLYHGIYDMHFPEGVTLLDSDLSHVYGNEEYELVSSREIQSGELFSGTANYYWMESFNQYSPLRNDSFQHMVGSVIHNKVMSFSVLSGINEFGSLAITKSVVGQPADPSAEFHFTLTLPNHPISGQYGDLKFTDGMAEFTLKDGETTYAKHLPAGADYLVTEAEHEGYRVSAENAQGIVAEEQTTPVSFVNTKINGDGEVPDSDRLDAAGSLVITKSVLGDLADRETEFHFVLTLSNQAITGQYGDLPFTDGVAEFTLRDGESKYAKFLPAGVDYTVIETNHEGYHVSAENTQGTIIEEESIAVSFTNIRTSDGSGGSEENGGSDGSGGHFEVNPPQVTGNLAMSKSVLGDSADQEMEFHFVLTLSNQAVTGQYGDLQFTDGVAKFTLRDGETKYANRLPAGADYTVVETEHEGFRVSAENAQGTIAQAETITVSFINTREMIEPEADRENGGQQLSKIPEDISSDTLKTTKVENTDVPKTSDDSALGLWIALFLLSLAGLYVQKKQKNAKKC